MKREELFKNDWIFFGTATMVLVAAFLVSICIGRYPIGFWDIFNLLFHGTSEEMAATVFFTLRLPRTVMAMLAGFGLSIAGSVYQTIFKNPLASPDIIGVAQGANAGAAFMIVLFGSTGFLIGIGAFIGGIVAVMLALLLAKYAKEGGIAAFVLAGIVIGTLAEGMIMCLKFFADYENQLATIEFWSMGSFAGITLQKMLVILPLFVVGVGGLLFMRWNIQILSLSDDEGKSLGISVEKARYGVLFCATLVVAAVVSVTGLITFIGLIAPHIGRLIRKRNDFATSIFSGMIGAILLIFADCLARSLTASEIPISIVTSFIGAPYLAFLMCKGERQL